MPMVEKITVVGLGYVGLPTAALMANAGYQVRGVDINEETVSSLKAGKCNLGEEEVARIVETALASGRLTAETTPAEADAFIICVPTPITDDKRPDLSMVTAAMKATAPFVRKGNLVILESTSPIGTTEEVIAGALKEVGLDPHKDVDVCYCPERVFPGETVREILENDRVVGGMTPEAAQRAKKLYRSFCRGQAMTTSARSAEFAKLMENTFRDVNIALANAFSHIAEQTGADVDNVITLANRHPRVNVLKPGPGVGGHCIPVDPWFLIDGFPEVSDLLLKSRRINDGQAEHLLNRAEDAGLERGAKVAILGAAYRGDIDDAREAPTEQLLKVLAERGYSWSTHDPHVTHMHDTPDAPANLTDNLEEAVKGAAAAFIMTDHSVYRSLSPFQFEGMASRLIIDGRRLLNADGFAQEGFTVVPIGARVTRPA